MSKVISIELAHSVEDLEQILALQAENHKSVVSKEGLSNGFVTVKHNLTLLSSMNASAGQVIAKSEGTVVGYALVMLEEFKEKIPVLEPMFDMFKSLTFNQRPLPEFRYYVMGQICVADGFRGLSIVDRMYAKHKEIYSKRFDVCLTEVSTSNPRSMRAHERVGFKTIHTFSDATDEWNILLWDWS
jgi:ribosomal protein S18 acetylase RimI-like enzyme